MTSINLPEGLFRVSSYPEIISGAPTIGSACSSCHRFIPLLAHNEKTTIVGLGKISAACAYCATENAFGVDALHVESMPDDIPLGTYTGSIQPGVRYYDTLKRALPGVIPTLSLSSLRYRQAAMQLLGECICAWTELETDLAGLLATLIKPHQNEAVAAVYLSIRNGSLQAIAMLAAAKIVLSDEDYRLLEAIGIVIKKVQDGRNIFAHSHIAAIPAEPLGLISISISSYHIYKTKLSSYSKEQLISEREKLFRVHSLANITRLRLDIKLCGEYISNFSVYLVTENRDVAESLNRKLFASPHIREALKELDDRAQNRSSEHRRGRPKSRGK